MPSIMRLLITIATTTLLLGHVSTVAAQNSTGGGCFGGVMGVTYKDEDDKCNCASVACTEATCVDDMGGTWTEDCPSCDPAECDPLAPSNDNTLYVQRDPSCTGPPEAIDR